MPGGISVATLDLELPASRVQHAAAQPRVRPPGAAVSQTERLPQRRKMAALTSLTQVKMPPPKAAELQKTLPPTSAPPPRHATPAVTGTTD